jgi:hypothetical protein
VPVEDGDTTGTVTSQITGQGTGGSDYVRTVVTRGGEIVQDVGTGPAG